MTSPITSEQIGRFTTIARDTLNAAEFEALLADGSLARFLGDQKTDRVIYPPWVAGSKMAQFEEVEIRDPGPVISTLSPRQVSVLNPTGDQIYQYLHSKHLFKDCLSFAHLLWYQEYPECYPEVFGGVAVDAWASVKCDHHRQSFVPRMKRCDDGEIDIDWIPLTEAFTEQHVIGVRDVNDSHT